ncbi:flagellar biosynthesis anti-sigma factor FlgM [Bermanella marisrubri]|uniref:Negative regulator of flagellin synthesis n=1 Tax=Bermanella marisrubri TaxID=207949 RepID=Q1N309_9GAMM|nr:flagellar biosynthesis anti-sigma factor FlgM [Bermanella marisrubri]EAT12510.1 Negative regulator of flagellin synthesis (anti-sigma28 factor) [Oceanobacter sp. RED65] [Bermanella marisrubri]QIZ84930.1 flagellar biosynthesis anti-sigma factor FlgM [Bermanella marisrubri]
MNINKLTNGIGGGGQSRSTEQVDKANAQVKKSDSSSSSSSDEVKLSAQSKSIQQIEAEVAKMPDIDDAAVERIKGALANNEYKIDYERIAGKMIKFDKLLN